MKRAIGFGCLTAVALLWPGMAMAASFDCTRAASAVERKICADPAVSKADEALAASFKAAMAATLDPQGLRADQRDWLRQRNQPDGMADLLKAYQSRIVVLDRRAAAWRAFARRFPAAKLASACFVTPEADDDAKCTVEESGIVAGDATLRYQLQGYLEDKLRMNGGAVVFAPGTDGMLTPIITAYVDTSHFGQPEIIKIAAGTLLFIPGHMEGTGNFNTDQLYLKVNGGWHDVDQLTWQAVLDKRLPKDLTVWKGIYPDYKKMTATTPLWDKQKDGNCCATGGRAYVKLRLDGTNLAIDSLTIKRGENAAEEE